jgi:hypothetical protein
MPCDPDLLAISSPSDPAPPNMAGINHSLNTCAMDGTLCLRRLPSEEVEEMIMWVCILQQSELDRWGGFSERLHLTAPRIRPRQEAENERVWGC